MNIYKLYVSGRPFHCDSFPCVSIIEAKSEEGALKYFNDSFGDIIDYGFISREYKPIRNKVFESEEFIKYNCKIAIDKIGEGLLGETTIHCNNW